MQCRSIQTGHLNLTVGCKCYLVSMLAPRSWLKETLRPFRKELLLLMGTGLHTDRSTKWCLLVVCVGAETGTCWVDQLPEQVGHEHSPFLLLAVRIHAPFTFGALGREPQWAGSSSYAPFAWFYFLAALPKCLLAATNSQQGLELRTWVVTGLPGAADSLPADVARAPCPTASRRTDVFGQQIQT